jgi:hypothetical protein
MKKIKKLLHNKLQLDNKLWLRKYREFRQKWVVVWDPIWEEE